MVNQFTLHNQFEITPLINRRHYRLLVTFKFLNVFLYFPGGFFIDTFLTLNRSWYNHFLSAVLFIILFFLSNLFVCETHFLPTLFIVVALELLKVSLSLFTLFRCLCFSVGMSLFFAILLSKSLILAVSYGTDCSFHLYNVGQFHVKKK